MHMYVKFTQPLALPFLCEFLPKSIIHAFTWRILFARGVINLQALAKMSEGALQKKIKETGQVYFQEENLKLPDLLLWCHLS